MPEIDHRRISLQHGKRPLILFDPQVDLDRWLLRRQLDGDEITNLGEGDIARLQKGISTDGILPSRGGRFQTQEDLAPFALAGIPGIKDGDIKRGQFGVVFVGPGFGEGSAREHAPRALRGAGIEAVVVAGGPARPIFRENCLFAGGPQVIESGDDLEAVNHMLHTLREKGEIEYDTSPDPIRPLIFREGGLLPFTQKRLEGSIDLPVISHLDLPANHPMTAVEKILTRKMINVDQEKPIVVPGDVGFVKTDLRFSYEFMTKMIIDSLSSQLGQDPRDLIADKGSVKLFEDHLVFAPEKFRSLITVQRHLAEQLGIELYRQQEGLEGSQGICHTLIAEKALVKPGEVAIGTDSHTCSAGVLGSLAFGVGATGMASALLTKDMFIEVPHSIKVELTGKLPEGCFAKDAMLAILANKVIRSDQANGKVLEFVGDGIGDWAIDQLFVLTNMSVEGGALTGIIPQPTEAVVAHLQQVTQSPREQIESSFVQSDTNAHYDHTISLDLSQLEPMIASPGHPTNGKPLSGLGRVDITGAYIGSCTGGNMSDLRSMAKVLEAASMSGQKAKASLTVQAASMTIYNQARKEGIDKLIESVGGTFLLPGCGACIGMGPGKVESPTDVIISDTNRNFPGRMGESEGEKGGVYLSNAAVVAASAIKGYICHPKEIIHGNNN